MEVPEIASPRGPKGQALQAVRQQAQFCARAGVVEPLDDVLNHSAVKPGRFQQLPRRVGGRHRLAIYRRFSFSWH
jgi:hypothetical protein